MSHYPVKPSFAVPSTTGLIAYQGRIDISRISPSTTTPLVGGDFTVPAILGSVTINVASSANFVVGDTVAVGERLGIYTTGAGPFSNPVAFSAYRTGSYRAGTNVSKAGYTVLSPNGDRTTITTSSWTIPVFSSPTLITGGLNVATPANIQASSKVIITNYAGVFKVTAKPSATSMTIQKIVDGDLAAGATCIAGDNSVITGAPVAGGTFLGTVPRIGTAQFFPLDIWYQPIAQVAPAGSGLTVNVGWSPNPDTGRDVYGDLSNRSTLLTSSSITTLQYARTAISAQDDQRLAAGWGLPIFLAVAAYGSTPGTGTVMSVTVRGFLSEIS